MHDGIARSFPRDVPIRFPAVDCMVIDADLLPAQAVKQCILRFSRHILPWSGGIGAHVTRNRRKDLRIIIAVLKRVNGTFFERQ